MFDKKLFFTLCEKYNIEFNDSAKAPMMIDQNGVHMVTEEDIRRVFPPCQTLFGYSDKKLETNNTTKTFYLQEDFGIAC